jgi:WD40 repeat-containing protein SMU1
MLRTSGPLLSLKTAHMDRYLKLEHFCKRPFFTPSEAYEMGSSKELRRQEIAESLICELSVVPPSRLLALLGQALKYQQSQNLIPPGVQFDLFRNTRKSAKKDAEERIPKRAAGDVKSTSTAKVDSIAFSPDGQCFITGSAQGLIEAWDVDTGNLKGDLEYQAKGEFMNLEDTVLCTAFSRDGDQIATGSKAGQIKVWKLSTGQCVRSFGQAHPQGITALSFSRDGTQLLSASYDQTARIHGMKSGKALKEFRYNRSNCGNARSHNN